jgi:hypothetical protein
MIDRESVKCCVGVLARIARNLLKILVKKVSKIEKMAY